MEYNIRLMNEDDYESVKDIFMQAIKSKIVTFHTGAPSYEEWDQSHLKDCRYVAVDENNSVLGWIALSPTSSRYVYRGVLDISIYIDCAHRGKHIGTQLLGKVIYESEKLGIWTLQSGIFEINEASIALHKKCGFRIIGVRERVGQDMDGNWQNTVIMERRSKVCGL